MDSRRLASASLALLSPLLSELGLPAFPGQREDEGKRRDGFLVLNLWELPSRDWRGGVWALVSLNAFTGLLW